MKRALVLGSSKGIGKEIKNEMAKMNLKIYSPSSKTLDTSNIKSVENFIKKIKSIDYLILNTGGPPAKNFFDITHDEWNKYFNQLFLGLVTILQKLKVNNNGYVFLISSHTIKSPEDNLVLSNSFRIALSSVFKTVSNLYSKKKINFINIAPGPIKTDRLKKLVGRKNMKFFENNLPLGKAGDPKDIARFVSLIIKNNIRYINGTTINFDGGLSKNIFG